MFEFVDIAHQKSAAGCHVGWRDYIEDLNLSRVGARRRGEMKIAVASDHRSSEEVLPVDHQSHLRPPCRSLDFIGHFKGKIPHEILLILCGMLADTSVLSVGQFPALSSDSGIHHR